MSDVVALHLAAVHESLRRHTAAVDAVEANVIAEHRPAYNSHTPLPPPPDNQPHPSCPVPASVAVAARQRDMSIPDRSPSRI